jgi:hypothetical protein
MKWILRIIAAPVVVLLALFVSACALLLKMSAYVLGLIGSILGLLSILVLLTGAIKNGIIVLAIAFLISPLGLPMLAAWLLGKISGLRYLIQDTVYG